MRSLVLHYLDLTRDVALGSGHWLVFNAVLATIPAVLATLLLGRRRAPSGAWWAGVAAFVLFLPNAPYVVTDLVHLRFMVTAYPGTPASAMVPFGALAALVVWGLASYAWCLAMVDRGLLHRGWSRHRVAVRSGLHLLCAFGVVLGRVPRLHSWHVLTRPAATVDGVVAVLDPRLVPLVVGLAVVFALMAAAISAVGRAAWARTLEVTAPARRLVLAT